MTWRNTVVVGAGSVEAVVVEPVLSENSNSGMTEDKTIEALKSDVAVEANKSIHVGETAGLVQVEVEPVNKPIADVAVVVGEKEESLEMGSVDEKPEIQVVEPEDPNVAKKGDEEPSLKQGDTVIVSKHVDVMEPGAIVVEEVSSDTPEMNYGVEKPENDVLEVEDSNVATKDGEKTSHEGGDSDVKSKLVDDVAERGVQTELVNESNQASHVVKSTNNPDDVENFKELVNGNKNSPNVETARIPRDVENITVATQQSAEEAGSESVNVKEEALEAELEDADEGEVIMEGLDSDEGTDGMIFGSSQSKQFIEELEREGGSGSHLSSHEIYGQIVTDSEEEIITDGEGEEEVFDSAAFAALLKEVTEGGVGGSDGGNITITSPNGSRLFSIERPAGLGSSVGSAQPMARGTRLALFGPPSVETEKELTQEEKKKLECVQVKFLRLVRRLGASPEESVAAQVLDQLAIVAGRPNNQAFSLDATIRTASELEAEGKDDLEFSINVLVIGKCGVGKSSTINSIFGEEKAKVGAFEPGTTEVREITGVVDGVKIEVIDTPGLKSDVTEQAFNRKVLSSVKKFMKKSPPDIVLYVDRLDTQTRDLNDLPMLKTITGALGQPIWWSAMFALTHGASAPPDGPDGNPLNYEVSVTQRSLDVQHSIGHAVGDFELKSTSLMIPVSPVENHPLCRKIRNGQKVLPNGQTWRPQLLLLCFSSKILAEANSISKPQDPFDHLKLFGFRPRSPPLLNLLKSILQARAHPKLPSDQGFDNGNSDVDMADFSDSDNDGEEDEYDRLPLSFDSDNPEYRYRFLEPPSQFIARPVLDTNGWDHDCGYDGVNLEQSLAIASCFPAAISVQFTKDKNNFSIHLNSSVAAKHGEDGSTMAGFDIQDIGKQLAYIVRCETKFKNLKKNKTAAGVSVTFLGENVATGLKIEDQIALGKQWAMVGNAGMVRCQGDAAYKANFELQRRELDYPIRQVQSTYGLSLTKWRGDWTLGFNSVVQFAIGRNSKVALRARINNKLSGKITLGTSSSDHLSLVLVGILPIATAIYKKIWPDEGDNYSIH